MAGYGSYAGNGSYLDTVQDEMGYGTASPGMLEPGYGGYGVYTGGAVAARKAMQRMDQDAENSRVAHDAFIKSADATRDFIWKGEDRELHRRALEADVMNREAAAQLQRDSYRAKAPLLADANDEAKRAVALNRKRREMLDAQRAMPYYMMFEELYEDGTVSQDTIAAYNESIKDDPNKAKLKGFEQDPNTGELYSILEDGSVAPFQSVAMLDSWVEANPQAEQWALMAYPPNIRKQKAEELKLRHIETQDALAAEKASLDAQMKARDSQMELMRGTIDDIDTEIKHINDRLKDDGYASEEERVKLNEQRDRLILERTNIRRQARTLWDKGYNPIVTNENAPTAQQQRVIGANDDAQRAGVSAGGSAAAKDWKDRGSNTQQQ